MTNHEAALELGALLSTPLKEAQREALVLAIGALENRGEYYWPMQIPYVGAEGAPREIGVSYTDHT